jgi:hypothetical protein
MTKQTSLPSRLVRAAKRLTVVAALLAAFALPVSASASTTTSHTTTSTTTTQHVVRPADDGVGDSPLVP